MDSEWVQFGETTLPILGWCDVVVVGGSLGNIAAALGEANAGRSVTLIEPRTYLGSEITATLRPWVKVDELDHVSPLLGDFIRATESGSQNGEFPLHLDALKVYLEDRLLAAGVKLLYASLPVGLTQLASGQHGLIIGNKSGRQVLSCERILDATPTEREEETTAHFTRTLEFDHVAPLAEGMLPVPTCLQLVGDQVILHAGYRGEGHLLVECEMALPGDIRTPFDITAREIRAHQCTMRLASYLLNAVPAFEGAYLAGASHELRDQVLSSQLPLPVSAEVESPSQPLSLKGKRATLHLREPCAPQRGRDYERAPIPAMPLPSLRTADVLVVGGGTSGATAAIVAARQGVRTLLVEMNAGLGGTGTYGGVHSYWFGRREGFAGQVMRWVEAMHEALRHEVPHGPVPKWNIEAKAHALLQEAETAGVEMLFNAFVIGAIVEGDAVRGVVVATRSGPVALLAGVVIDATGDGDVAAHAGASLVYGSEREHAVMWTSLAQFVGPGRTRNNFTSMVDVSNIEDVTRGILVGRRRGRDGTHEHGSYLAPRESRHILGEVVLTLTDQLLQRRWPDVVNVAFSNHDVKGHSDSDWIRIGLIPPNLEVEIPYRALLPQGLENLLVVGKALSAEHDALPAIRMQPDMENLGGVAGLAAAQAVRKACSPREIDVEALQARLVEEGVLPESVRTRELMPWRVMDEDLAERVDALDAETPLYAYSDMPMNDVFRGHIPLVQVCCAGPRVVPLLERALMAAHGEQALLLARVLGMLGSQAGVPVLVAAIEAELAGGGLPERDSRIPYAGAPPDQGAMPDVVYLLHALGMARDPRALSLWRHVVDLLAAATDEDVQSGVKGIFYYVEAVCAGAERLGDPAAIPLLTQLHGYAPFHGHVLPKGLQVDYFAERLAYLELLIARALARCGSAEGYRTLIPYLGDVRALLAEHAHEELQALTGEDFGKDEVAWLRWLDEQGDALSSVPYLRPSEPVRAWREELLLTSGQA